jgi:carbonic anhydrase
MESKKPNLSSHEAMELLCQGNARYVDGLKTIGALSQIERTKELAGIGQRPFCAVITCSDSRFPVEILFDRGPGDIFVIRSFGTLVDPMVAATVEYAVLSFDIQLVIVLGNPVSGAFRLAMEAENQEQVVTSPYIHKVIKAVEPALHHAKMKESCFNPLDRSIPEDRQMWDRLIKLTCQFQTAETCNELLKLSPLLMKSVKSGNLTIAGATVNIDTGRVFEEAGEAEEEKLINETIEPISGVKSVRKR